MMAMKKKVNIDIFVPNEGGKNELEKIGKIKEKIVRIKSKGIVDTNDVLVIGIKKKNESKNTNNSKIKNYR